MPVKAVQSKTVYETTDGSVFTNEQFAIKHEKVWQLKKFFSEEYEEYPHMISVVSCIEESINFEYFTLFLDRWVDRMYQLKMLPTVTVGGESGYSLAARDNFSGD